MNQKYEFVEGDTITIAPGRTVKRIRALVAITPFGVIPGDIGGYIESEANLSISDSARVYGSAWVSPIFISGLRWIVTIEDININIGCQHHPAIKWENFTDEEISNMDDNALEFWKMNKNIILQLAKTHGNFTE